MIFGNGLRPQIWKQFVDRFNIPKVGEFYGATEGNANIGKLERKLFNTYLVPSHYSLVISHYSLPIVVSIRVRDRIVFGTYLPASTIR